MGTVRVVQTTIGGKTNGPNFTGVDGENIYTFIGDFFNILGVIMNTTELTKVALFEGERVRKTLFNDEWYFSVVDVCKVLTESPDASAYWRKLKQRLMAEGSQVVTFCHGLKLEASDGKKYKTDCANMEDIFRIIQSIPSAKSRTV